MDQSTVYINCISGVPTELVFENGKISASNEPGSAPPVKAGKEVHPIHKDQLGTLYIGPGLVDLQVNGINGIDFNDVSVTSKQIREATHFLLSQGITSFFPTLVTNSEQNISGILTTIKETCASDDLVNHCIAGIHLEGPFLSAVPGAKGAHDERYLRLPDYALIEQWQQAAGGRIKLITIAPELVGAISFINKCRVEGIMVSIGHSMANNEQIGLAIEAGASLSTHLGNAVPLTLPRHPNILWDLLAMDELYTCIIADGIHVPDSFIKVVMKVKAQNTLLVSDATRFAGMSPGEYESPIGGIVVLDADKRVNLSSTPGLLAGAAKTLLENVETLMEHQLATLAEAWKMASSNVVDMLAKHDYPLETSGDFVLFESGGSGVKVKAVIKKGRLVSGNLIP